jgi:hypothetical protein
MDLVPEFNCETLYVNNFSSAMMATQGMTYLGLYSRCTASGRYMSVVCSGSCIRALCFYLILRLCLNVLLVKERCSVFLGTLNILFTLLSLKLLLKERCSVISDIFHQDVNYSYSQRKEAIQKKRIIAENSQKSF